MNPTYVDYHNPDIQKCYGELQPSFRYFMEKRWYSQFSEGFPNGTKTIMTECG